MTNLETKIIAHHVGGRGFEVSLKVPPIFKTDIVHVLYEADAECVEEMNRSPDTPQADLLDERYLFPYCLGRSNGRGRLNITANTYASSMLVPDPSFFKYCCELQIGPAFYDVTYDDMLKIVKQVDVDVHSLDQLFVEGKLPAKIRPDFLSLDTQGLERDIMEGAQRVIREDVVGIVTEVEIAPMYGGQPLLGDILHTMNTYGFHFAGFTNLHEISQYRAPIGLRGKSFPGFGDALFLRKVENFENMGLSKPELFLKANKLAFISLVFGHVEYALKALSLATSLRAEVQSDLLEQLGHRAYFACLQHIESSAREVERIYPPTFGIPSLARLNNFPYPAPSWYDSNHEEAVADLTVSVARSVTWADRLYAHLKYHLAFGSSNSKAVSKVTYYLIRCLRRIFPGLSNIGLSMLTAGRDHTSSGTVAAQEEGYSSFESVLVHYGLIVVADTVRQKRVVTERFVRSLPPLWKEGGQRNPPFNQP